MRIIGGTCRGRNLKSPKGMLTRPTQDRVRETIFNVLQNYGLYNRTVLDLFAGTGAMGLEALSRGAHSLVAVDHKTGKLIEENAKLCGMDDRVTVVNGSMERNLPQLHGKQFQLIFADPPYNKGFMEKTIAMIESKDLAEDGAIIVLECDKLETLLFPSHWILVKEQIFGYTKVSYCKYSRSREESRLCE